MNAIDLPAGTALDCRAGADAGTGVPLDTISSNILGPSFRKYSLRFGPLILIASMK